MEVLWFCPDPECGAENIDPEDTEIFHCSLCLKEFTREELELRQVSIVRAVDLTTNDGTLERRS